MIKYQAVTPAGSYFFNFLILKCSIQMTVYLSSAYLAPVEYYTKLLAYDQIYIEQHDHYTKQT